IAATSSNPRAIHHVAALTEPLQGSWRSFERCPRLPTRSATLGCAEKPLRGRSGDVSWGRSRSRGSEDIALYSALAVVGLVRSCRDCTGVAWSREGEPLSVPGFLPGA